VRTAVVDEAVKVYGNATDGFLTGFKATNIPNINELQSSAARIFTMIDDREGPFDPLEFWKRIEQSYYPLLAPLARLLFAIPPSSASNERDFSNSGNINSGRERLTADHLEQLSICRSYFQAENFIHEIFTKKLLATVKFDEQ
jgi:hAT family C-terminal dimerisation region